MQDAETWLSTFFYGWKHEMLCEIADGDLIDQRLELHCEPAHANLHTDGSRPLMPPPSPNRMRQLTGPTVARMPSRPSSVLRSGANSPKSSSLLVLPGPAPEAGGGSLTLETLQQQQQQISQSGSSGRGYSPTRSPSSVFMQGQQASVVVTSGARRQPSYDGHSPQAQNVPTVIQMGSARMVSPRHRPGPMLSGVFPQGVSSHVQTGSQRSLTPSPMASGQSGSMPVGGYGNYMGHGGSMTFQQPMPCSVAFQGPCLQPMNMNFGSSNQRFPGQM